MRNLTGKTYCAVVPVVRRRRLAMELLEPRRVLSADLASIRGTVFEDISGDGLTAGEELAGVTVQLFRDDGDRRFDPVGGDSLQATDVTGADGLYRFDAVTAGTYFVRQPAQNGGGKDLEDAVSQPITITASQAQGTAGLTIDSFDRTSQSVSASRSSTGTNPDGSSRAAPEALGGQRDLFVELTSTSGRLELLANDTTPGLLEFGALGTTTGTRLVAWDGPDDDPAVLDPVGLGGVDLTEGGLNVGLQLAIGSDHDGGVATIRVYTDAGHWSRAAVAIPNTGGSAGGRVLVSFADDFLPAGSDGGADFTRAGAVQFELDGVEAIDGQLDLLATIAPTVLHHDFANHQRADLALNKTVDNTSPRIGQDVTFTITLRNDGPDPATNVTVSDPLPDGLKFASAAADQGSYDRRMGTWTVGTVPAGATARLDITATVLSSGLATNAAQVATADQFDPDSIPGNNIPTEDDQDSASLQPEVADLALVKTVDQPVPNVGDTVRFTVTVRNDGPDRATGVGVRDVLPAGLQFVSAAADQGSYNDATGTWTVGTISSGAAVTLQLNASVTAPGAKTNTAEISAADQFDIDSTPGNHVVSEDDQDRTVVIPQVVDLELTKTVDRPAANVGQDVTFAVTLANAGPDVATGVVVRDVLPAGLTLVSATADRGTYDAATGRWTVGTVGQDAVGTLDLVATVTTPGSKTNTAEVTATDQFDIDSTPGNNVPAEDDQASVMVTSPVVDLSLTKTVDRLAANVGQDVTFTVTLANAGPDVATGVVVRDVLPAGLTLVSATADHGTYDMATGRWTVGMVNQDAVATLDLVATVTTPGSKTNTAEVTAADQFDMDSTPGNNVPAEDDQASVMVTAPVVDLSLTKTVDRSAANVGEDVTFTVTLANAGPDVATGVVVRDVLPAGLTLVSATADQGTYDTAAGLWHLGTVPADTGHSLDLVATLTTPGVKTNVAEVTAADQFDGDSTPGNHVAGEDDQDQVTLTPMVSLSGFVYVDANNDGTKQPGERGVAGTTITLTGTDDLGNSIRRITQTDAAGRYVFGNLRPSAGPTYQVEENQPAGLRDGKDTPGTPFEVTPLTAAAVDDVFRGIGLEPGVHGHDFNFGELATLFSKRQFLASSR